MLNKMNLSGIIAIIAIMFFSMAACKNGATHTHTPGTGPTCTTAQTCTDCGAIINAALRHDGIDWSTIDPSTGKVSCNRTGCDGGMAAIGDTGPGAGKIIYVTASGFTVTSLSPFTAHYLEAASVGQGTLEWASSSFTNEDISGTGTAIGTGKNNTALILSKDSTAPAAKACDVYAGGGRNDWFLPSKDELNELNKQKSLFSITTGRFWSSTQYGSDNNQAFCQSFGNNSDQNGDNKDEPFNVRAVRAF